MKRFLCPAIYTKTYTCQWE